MKVYRFAKRRTLSYIFRPLELELLMSINEDISLIDKLTNAIGLSAEKVAWNNIRKELVEGRKTPDNTESVQCPECGAKYDRVIGSIGLIECGCGQWL